MSFASSPPTSASAAAFVFPAQDTRLDEASHSDDAHLDDGTPTSSSRSSSDASHSADDPTVVSDDPSHAFAMDPSGAAPPIETTAGGPGGVTRGGSGVAPAPPLSSHHNLLKKGGGPGSLVLNLDAPSTTSTARPPALVPIPVAPVPVPPSLRPVRRFDPFAPLPPSSPPKISFEEPVPSSTLAPVGASESQRRTSLYLPLDPPTSDTDDSKWLRERQERFGSGADELVFPKSPSLINPAYGFPPSASLSRSPSASSRPLDSIGEEHSERSGSPPPHRRGLSPPRGNRRTAGPNSTPEMGRHAFPDAPSYSVPVQMPRHSVSYSIGTQSLLASRLPLARRLAVAADTPTAWLIMYFAFNLGLTLYNKLVLQGFPFPWTLTGIQMLSGTVGTQVALSRGYFTQTVLSPQENLIMILFSTLYTINIAVSNLSLHLVTVPFHQVVRAMTPLFTIILSVAFFHKRFSRATYLSLVPVVLGVAFATYGDYNFTAWGFFLTLLGTLLAALKTIVTNRIQVGRLKLHPLDLLIRMSPLAFMQCVLWGWYSGELERVRAYSATQMTQDKAVALLLNGVIAFGLNVVSFTANKKTSALTMTVAANVKQVLTIVLAVLIFSLSLNATNLFGITLTLGGGAWYAAVELREKSGRPKAEPEKRPALESRH